MSTTSPYDPVNGFVLSHFSCVPLFATVAPWTVAPRSSVLWILQARILEWVAMSFSIIWPWPICFLFWKNLRTSGFSLLPLRRSPGTRQPDQYPVGPQAAASFLLFSCSVVSDSQQPHGLQHARLLSLGVLSTRLLRPLGPLLWQRLHWLLIYLELVVSSSPKASRPGPSLLIL